MSGLSWPCAVLALALGSAGSAEPPTYPPAAPPPRPQKTSPPPPRVQRSAASGVEAARDLRELGLQRQGDGAYLYTDPGLRFTAKFNPDGTVHFADRWRRPSAGDSQSGRCCALPPGGLPAINPLYGAMMTGPVEWMLMAQGQDLATKAKMDLLEQTRELRTQVAIAYHVDLIQKRLRELGPELMAVWGDRSMPLPERKNYLFTRWDDCDEHFHVNPDDIPPEATLVLDEARTEAAETARRQIEAFIRRHAPNGSPRAFRPEELRAMNARRISKQAFRPYDASG